MLYLSANLVMEFRTILVIGCSIVFLMQGLQHFMNYFSYPTNVRKSTKQLKQIDFPVVQICLKQGLNMTFLKQQGYNTTADYIMGQGKDKTFIGWVGTQGLNITSFFKEAQIWKRFDDIVHSIQFGEYENFSNATVEEVDMNYPQGKCYRVLHEKGLDASTHVNYEALWITFNSRERESVTISVTSPSEYTYRPDLFTFTGDSINKRLSKYRPKWIDVYSVQLHQNKALDIDSETDCVNYKKSYFGHYKHCVSKTINNRFRGILNCIPPWFWTKNESDVCSTSFNGDNSSEVPGLVLRYLDQSNYQV